MHVPTKSSSYLNGASCASDRSSVMRSNSLSRVSITSAASTSSRMSAEMLTAPQSSPAERIITLWEVSPSDGLFALCLLTKVMSRRNPH
jgi:hypothetical protein